MRRLKIAIFEPSRIYPGGGQKNMANIANYLSKKNDVTIFTQMMPEKGLNFGKSGIELIKPQNRYLASLAFYMHKLNKDYDVVIYGCFPATLAINKNNMLPSVHVTHSPPRFFYDLKEDMLSKFGFIGKMKVHTKNILFKGIDYRSVQKIDKILGISEEIKKRIKLSYNRDSDVFYPGIDKRKYYNRKYGNFILAPGRIVFTKRPWVIVESARYLKNKDIKIVLVGTGDLDREMAEKAKEYSQIDYKGYIDEKELGRLYSECLAVIQIPINEDYGYVAVEAAASSKAVIGSNEGGLKETVINNKTGILIDDVDSQKLAEKIDFLAENRDIAIKMGGEAKKYVRKFYLENTFKVLDNALIEAIREKKAQNRFESK